MTSVALLILPTCHEFISLPVTFPVKPFIYGHLSFLSSHNLSDLPPFSAEKVDAERARGEVSRSHTSSHFLRKQEGCQEK